MKLIKSRILIFALNILTVSFAMANRLSPFEEAYIGSTQIEHMQGAGMELGVLATLKVPKGSYIESLIITSSSAQGFGRIEVLANQQVIGTLHARESIQVEQVTVRNMVGRGLQSLRLKTYGNIQIVHYAVTVNKRLSENHGELPGQNQIIDAIEFQSIISELKNTSFDSGKEAVVASYMKYWSGRKVMMNQLSEMIRTMSFDSNKINVIRMVKPLLLVDVTQMGLILNQLSFDSSKTEARQIILSDR